MQLLRNVYLVGGKHFYATVRGVADCNVYAVKTSEGIVLVDCGYVDCGYNEASLEMIDRNLRYWDLDPLDIRYVLLTHSHFDHTGNARALKGRGAKLVAHHTVGEALATGDERTIPYLEQGTTIVDNALMIALQAWGNGYSKRRSR